jgi:hypothetical protein
LNPPVASLPTPIVPSEFLPRVGGAPLSTPVVPLGFLPRAVPTIAPHVAPTVPTAVTYGPPTRAWPASPRQPPPTSTTPPPPHQQARVVDQGVVVPIMPLENPHRMITWDKTSFRVVPDHLVLIATPSSPTPSPIPTSTHAALANPNWCAAMEEEYWALMRNGTWELVPRP